MNKAQTLAAHRIKTAFVESANNVAIANKKVSIAEAKVAKVHEALDVAKDIVAKHKDTLELAKKQILEQRALIKKYEALLDIKYQQVESMKSESAKATRSIKSEAEAKCAKFKAACDNANKAIEINKKHYEIAKQQVTESSAKLEKCMKLLNRKYSEVKSLQEQLAKAKAESAKESADLKRIKTYEKLLNIKYNEIDSLKNENAELKAKIAPVEVQKVAPADATKAKAESTEVKPAVEAKPETEAKAKNESARADESKLQAVAKVYHEKYGMPEATSMNVLRKYSMDEAINKLQSIANTIKKYQSKANESKPAINPSVEAKNESVVTDESLEGVRLYDTFLI